ncbi:hypothetical protein B0H17DRAFT_1049994 [Mycena rosella]|uniref:F-box domain-containing protein n=1 Tax=Mycena rosella TaxID=1033263 RepID=A0AAD7GKK1_MYCRO|nr:hypothetical protein B0H17DRAFT_1049994 [Mycena rosella]
MAQNLPPELIDLILGELQPNGNEAYNASGTRTIARCGLVCKQWLSFSRVHLFAHVELDEGSLEKLITIVEASPFPISSFIRCVRLSFRRDGFEQGLRALGSLPRVKTLRIVMSNIVFTQNLARLAITFANTSTVVFNGYQFPFGDIMDAISLFPSLADIELNLAYLGHKPLLSTYRFPGRWHSLTIFMVQDEMQKLFEVLFSLDTIPVLSSLSIHLDQSHALDQRGKTGFLEKYLRHVGSRLRYLQIKSGQTGHYVGLPALEYSTGLSCLDLQFTCEPGTPALRFVLRIVSHLQSRALTTITVQVVSHDTTTFVPHEWQQLDQALADARFSSLQAFTLQTPWPIFVAHIPDHMPLSKARGILRVMVVHC